MFNRFDISFSISPNLPRKLALMNLPGSSRIIVLRVRGDLSDQRAKRSAFAATSTAPPPDAVIG